MGCLCRNRLPSRNMWKLEENKPLMALSQLHLIEDAMIAATALVHDLTVVTPNVKDFMAFGVQMIDPWVNVT